MRWWGMLASHSWGSRDDHLGATGQHSTAHTSPLLLLLREATQHTFPASVATAGAAAASPPLLLASACPGSGWLVGPVAVAVAVASPVVGVDEGGSHFAGRPATAWLMKASIR